MGRFKRGATRPPGSGMKKGRPNNKTLILKSITDELGLDVPRRLGELLPKLNPAKQADVLLALLDYIYPKRRAVEHSGPQGGPIEVVPSRAALKQLLANPTAFAALESLEVALESKSTT